ncbi:unnamed protein product, partial [marine sediment metagenome]
LDNHITSLEGVHFPSNLIEIVLDNKVIRKLKGVYIHRDSMIYPAFGPSQSISELSIEIKKASRETCINIIREGAKRWSDTRYLASSRIQGWWVAISYNLCGASYVAHDRKLSVCTI